MERYTELARAHERAIWTARMIVDDSQISALLPTMADQSEGVMARVRDVLARRKFSGQDAAGEWLENATFALAFVTGGLSLLETLTRERLAEDLPPRRRRFRLRRS